jgi:hypothetical protein
MWPPPAAGQSEIEEISTVRNNLFHGGKFPLLLVRDSSRDRDLLTHAINILDAALRLDARVHLVFLEGLDCS